ncbi:MAG: uncharacterized protein JWN04_136 [Myxococcaceae bacterium]|nr:uncharacterized protein [Myxococcaceae bacterium]
MRAAVLLRCTVVLLCWGVVLGEGCADGAAPPPPSEADPAEEGQSGSRVDAGSRPSRADATVVNNPLPSDAAVRDSSAADARIVDASASDASAPPVVLGKPFTAPDKTWTWIDFPDSFCRDGSTAGIAVSLNSASDDLMIYLEGGGACFDSLSCLANPTTAPHGGPSANDGVFDRSNALNPVRDMNFVYVPYCSGDVHAGTNPSSMVPGVAGTQKFVGRLNIEAFLKRVVPTFPNAKKVVLTGISAGGFGAAASAVPVQRAFPNIKIALIDDSGPPLSSKYVTPCLQKTWRELWGLDNSMLADCGSDCKNKDDFLLDFALHLAATYSDRKAGLLESAQDGIISGFFGAGMNNCTGIVLLTPIPGDQYQQGLVEFRDAVKAYPNFATFYPPGTQHTWLGGASFYTLTVGGTKLVDWVSNIIADKPIQNVGP